MQYTIRQVPKKVDKVARAKAKADGKSLNQTLLEAIQTGLGVCDEIQKRRDLSDLVGSMTTEDARAIEEAHEWFDRVWPEEKNQ